MHKTYSFLDAAEKMLEQFGNRSSMHYRDITDKAMEKGLIISTSDFSAGAVKEANQPDKTPVDLMNGEQLAMLLMEYNIGVRRMSYGLFELEALPND